MTLRGLIHIIGALWRQFTGLNTGHGTRAAAVVDQSVLHNPNLGTTGGGRSSRSLERRAPCPALKGTAGILLGLSLTLIAVITLLSPTEVLAETPGGTRITNIAEITANLSETFISNTALVMVRSDATLEMMRYAPDVSVSENVTLQTSEYSSSADSHGPFTALTDPLATLGNLLKLTPYNIFSVGSTVFFQLTDRDQNLNPTQIESVFLTVTVSGSGDQEFIRIYETGPDTGIFIGYLPSEADATLAATGQPGDGLLQAQQDTTIEAAYADIIDGTDTAAVSALVDPYGIVFDSLTGQRINGATVTLINALTGQPATILGEDGISSYPSTVISGEVTFDSSHRAYASPAGGFRFPLIAPGTYRLDIDPPAGYVAPSSIPTASIQSLPDAPYAIEPGSRGETFIINPGPAIHIDIPIDPVRTRLWVEKSANKDLAAIGDFLSYRILIENHDLMETASAVVITDKLPLGFRYQQGSTRIDGVSTIDPTINGDGRTLTFHIGDLPAEDKREISYVVELAAGAAIGEAINTASATAENGFASNVASAAVTVRDDFFRSESFVFGEVLSGACNAPDEEIIGMPDVRVYLEDGTSAMTDKNGKYHIEGLRPGTHVVQLDIASIPEWMEAVPCEENTQFAGRSFSQFVDLQGGTLWRADFRVALRPRIKGDASVELNSTLEGGIADFSLPLHVGEVALDNLRLTMNLPEGATYRVGSSRLSGTMIPDPEIDGGSLTFPLGDWDEQRTGNLTLQAEIANTGKTGELWATAVLAFDTPLEAGKKTPSAKNKLVRTEVRIQTLMPEIILHPHFPTLGAKLAPEDKEMLDRLVDKFQDRKILHMYSIGHTDNVRISPQSRHIYKDNFALSAARAETISAYLGQAFSLSPSQKTVVGLGAALPIADNETDEGKAQNRRVEVRFVTEATSTTQQLELIQAKSGTQKIVMEGLRPGESLLLESTVKEKITNEEKTQPDGIIYPLNNQNLYNRVISIQVKLDSNLTAKLTLDGKEVSEDRIGFNRTDPKTGKVLLTYIGIDFGQEGKHLLKLEGIGPFGNARFKQEIEVIRTGEISGIRVLASDGNIADGKTPVTVRLQLVDSKGQIINAPITLAIKEGNLKPELEDDEFKDPTHDAEHVKVDAQGYAHFQPTQSGGLYHATLGYGDKTIEIETYVKPQMRDWILVGFAEGTAGYNTLSGNQTNLEVAETEDHFYHDEQVSFFAKGAIKGEWLLTMAYDSNKPNLDGESLQQVIDPDAYYPLYGDETRQNYEAASARKIYVKLERNQFYALFGDMQTGLTQTELSRYSRSMNGFKSEMQGENFSYNLFAADTRQGFVKDEIRGDGTSGRYSLSHPDLVMNSETVTIETRDRFHSEQVLDVQTLTRHTDYDIDYDNGSLFFKRPVPSKNENFDPVFIVATYETAASSKRELNYGGRVAVKGLDQTLEVGATHVHEQSGTSEGNLYGVDAKIQLGAKNSLKVEAATTDTKDLTQNETGEAFLAEFEHSSEKVRASAYYRQQNEGFGLGQQNGSESGTRKYGAEGNVRLTPQTSVSGLAYHEDNLTTDADRDVAELQAEQEMDQFSVHGGVREARDTLGDGSKKDSRQLLAGGDWTSFDKKLILRAAHEQSLGSQNENSDYPTLTLLGADYRLNRKVSLFIEQEFSWGEDKNTEGTRTGLKATPWRGGDAQTSVERQIDENGERIFALFGFGQTWQVSKYWSADASLDRSYTVKDSSSYDFDTDVPAAHGSDDDFTAVSLGATYERDEWSWSNRLEVRHADSEDKYGLVSGLVGQIRPGVSASARYSGLFTDRISGDKDSEQQLTFGLAYRPVKSRWIFLDRLDASLDREQSSLQDDTSWRLVNNLHANLKLNRKWQIAPYYGLKYVRENFSGSHYDGFTDLYALETRYNLTKRWDLGLHGSVLHSWNCDQLDYSNGASVGYLAMTNLWASLGYNFEGFRDEDFSQSNYTAKGVYLKFRLKFDQNSLTEALEWMNQQ